MSVQTNIGKIFFKLIDQHFPKNHKYHKIFNRNTLKMSYSCMSNMADRIKAHNNKILNQETSQSITDSDQEKCNCRQKEEYPLKGKCLTTAIVYQTTVQYDGKTAKYLQKGTLKPVTEITLNPSNILSTKQKPSYQIWFGH